ncbi:unnamed protein product [Ambrosiozyma monospora]|uniref:Unnamed protein product n=1 Tax=Ambrosiozyma monospora TaxID=43982 RepID=A0ACB5TPI5_AMBMO|nr:unnamed protein product [Ambrosiozyma monospora]
MANVHSERGQELCHQGERVNKPPIVRLIFSRHCEKCKATPNVPNTSTKKYNNNSQNKMMDTIRVVICGDEGVGKSSILTSLIKDKFVPNIQHVIPPITIPRDFSSSTYSPKSTILIDTLSSDVSLLQSEIRHADVIWLVYSDHYTYERISLYWIPMFRSMGVNLPVVICNNMMKADTDDHESELQQQQQQFQQHNMFEGRDVSFPDYYLLNNNSSSDVEDLENVINDEFVPLLKEFKEVEACIRCCAKDNHNVNQAFYLCQRAVSHPIAPLYDYKDSSLKPLAVAALNRIFYLCDRDQDGFLSDDEFMQLQQKCFHKNIE